MILDPELDANCVKYILSFCFEPFLAWTFAKRRNVGSARCPRLCPGTNYYIDTNMSSSKKLTCKGALQQLFIKVHRLETQTVILIFSAQFCELLPLSPSLWCNSPGPLALPCVKVQYMAGRGWGCWVLFETIFCRSLTLSIWPDSDPSKLLYHPKSMRRGSLRQINTCRKVPL